MSISVRPVLAGPSGPPATQTQSVVDKLHGEEIVDPYRWLEDGKSPQTREWIKAQNEHTDAWLAEFAGRDTLRKRAEEFLRNDHRSAPYVRGTKLIYTRRLADEQLPVIAMRDNLNGEERVLLDPLKEKGDGSVTYVLQDVSHDGQILTYGVRVGGEDEVTIRFFDLQQEQHLDTELPRGRYFGVQQTPDHKTLYYTLHDKDGSRVYRRALAKDAAPEKIFGDGFDSGVGLSTDLSGNGRWLLIHAWFGSSGDKTEIYLQDLQAGTGIVPLVKGIESRFEGQIGGDACFVSTNWQAPRGRVLRIDLAHPEQEHWTEIVPESPAVLEEVALVDGKLCVHHWQHVPAQAGGPAGSVLTLRGVDGALVSAQLPAQSATVTGLHGEWDAPYLFITTSSFLLPDKVTVFHVQPGTGELTFPAGQTEAVWHQTVLPFAAENYVVTQVQYPSKDGTLVPMYLVHRKDLIKDGKQPVLLYGYGGFNISLKPLFSSRAALWCDLGGVYAMPNLRGGGELGEEWHRAGMREKKQNVFDDLHAAAEWLIREGYTNPGRIAVSGRSNGGLLVGAALTQRPDLYRAVICGYPLLDMVRFHQFLVARFWIPEYGSADDPAQFAYLKKYSPYHNIDSGTKYPSTLFITGDADTRVDPLHARKMAARLQLAQKDCRPVLLRYETELGHTGARPVKKVAEDLADEFSFLCRELRVHVEVADANKELEQIFSQEWDWTLREFPMFATHLGDKRYNTRWTDLTLESIDSRMQHYREVLRRLEQIPAEQLTAANRLNRTLFQKQVSWDLQELELKWFLIPLNQREGIQDESTLADSIHFETEQDYLDWLARLQAFPKYLYQTKELMRRGIREGRVHPRVILERIPQQIRRQIVEAPEASLYYKPFREFPKTIPTDRIEAIRASARRTIANGVVPAYRDFLRFFEDEYLPAGLPEVGVWQLPQGDEIYAFRIQQFTTTNLTADEIHEIGLSEVARIRKEMERIVEQVKFQGTFDEFLEHLRSEKKFYCQSEQELFAEYQAVMKRIDPLLPKMFGRLPRIPYDLQPIPAHMAPDTTTAYYRPPSADGSRPGTYFVNLYRPEVRPRYEMEALSLHEAVPGHHLQIALATELENVPTFRRFGQFTAYVEGWALYAESLGTEMGLYQDPYSKFGQLTYEMWRAVRLVVDTGMHSKHWTRQQAIDFFLKNTAKTEHDIVNEVDRYIAWPGQALAYKIGELKIKELRRRAEEQLGDKFDLRTFHDKVLELGAVPLDVLDQHIQGWIDTRKAGG